MRTRTASVLALLPALSALSALSQSPTPVRGPGGPPAKRAGPGTVAPDMRRHDQGFGKFVDDYFAAVFAYSPGFGTSAGFHEWDDKAEDRSRARIEARVAELKDFQARLAKIDRGALSFDDRIDADILENRMKGFLLEGSETGEKKTTRATPRSPRGSGTPTPSRKSTPTQCVSTARRPSSPCPSSSSNIRC